MQSVSLTFFMLIIFWFLTYSFQVSLHVRHSSSTLDSALTQFDSIVREPREAVTRSPCFLHLSPLWPWRDTALSIPRTSYRSQWATPRLRRPPPPCVRISALCSIYRPWIGLRAAQVASRQLACLVLKNFRKSSHLAKELCHLLARSPAVSVLRLYESPQTLLL